MNNRWINCGSKERKQRERGVEKGMGY